MIMIHKGNRYLEWIGCRFAHNIAIYLRDVLFECREYIVDEFVFIAYIWDPFY